VCLCRLSANYVKCVSVFVQALSSVYCIHARDRPCEAGTRSKDRKLLLTHRLCALQSCLGPHVLCLFSQERERDKILIRGDMGKALRDLQGQLAALAEQQRQVRHARIYARGCDMRAFYYSMHACCGIIAISCVHVVRLDLGGENSMRVQATLFKYVDLCPCICF
jgi:hypothetical protein